MGKIPKCFCISIARQHFIQLLKKFNVSAKLGDKILLICTHNHFSRFEDSSCLEVGNTPSKAHIHPKANAG